MTSNSSLINKPPNNLIKMYYNAVPFKFRYDAEFYKTFKFLKKSANWSDDKLRTYQNDQFIKLVDHCLKNVPYYQEMFADYGLNSSSIGSIDDISKIPTLNKEKIIKNFEKLQAVNFGNTKKYLFSTSGSTGEKLKFYGTDDVFKKEAAFVLRFYKSTGATMYDKPSIWIRRYVPKKSSSPLWYYDYELKRLYMSAYHLNENTINEYFSKINDIKATTLVTYPSSAYIMALLAKKNNLTFKNIKHIRVASEKMQKSWYSEINTILGITPLAHYGQIEKVSFMNQKVRDLNYHVNYEYGVTEFVKNEYGTQSILGTGFLNYYMPLLRYETNDHVSINIINKNSTVVSDIEGRLSDILISKEGSLLPGINFFSWIDKNLENIGIYQIIQKKDRSIEFLYVPLRGEVLDESIIIDGLQQRLGALPIRVIIKDEIKRNKKTGKIKLIQNEVPI